MKGSVTIVCVWENYDNSVIITCVWEKNYYCSIIIKCV